MLSRINAKIVNSLCASLYSRVSSVCLSIGVALCFAMHLNAQDALQDGVREAEEGRQSTQNKEFIKNLTQPEVSELLEMLQSSKNETFAMVSNLSLQIGEYGVIMRDLDSYQAVVASVEVVEIVGARAKVKILPFHQLHQPYLPTPVLTPEVGDKVIFRSFNDKAFIIAPNEESYNAIMAEYPFIKFINSDLLMGFLNSQGKHDPNEKTLPRACNEYGVGIVFVVGSENVAVLGCQNLGRLFKYPNAPINQMQSHSPFYTRVHFEGGGSLSYSLSSKKSKEYFKYYDALIGDVISTK